MPKTPKNPPVRKTAHQREERRVRIMGQVRAGLSYESIARDENLSRERIRQIVTQSLTAEKAEPLTDHNRLQIARLEPALRLAARGIESGKLQAIGHLLKVLEKLDKYGVAVRSVDRYDATARERLLGKLNRNAERLGLFSPKGPDDETSDDSEQSKDLETAKSGLADL